MQPPTIALATLIATATQAHQQALRQHEAQHAQAAAQALQARHAYD